MIKPIIVIINGPNLNLLGKRQPEIYGTVSFEEYIVTLRGKYTACYLAYHQTNHEGEIIDFIHHYGFECEGIVLNAGGYTHTSIAIRDAIASISAPVVEVHISDIYTREDFRKTNYLRDQCKESFIGLGLEGYDKAVEFLLNQNI